MKGCLIIRSMFCREISHYEPMFIALLRVESSKRNKKMTSLAAQDIILQVSEVGEVHASRQARR